MQKRKEHVPLEGEPHERPTSTVPQFPQLEEETLRFWDAENIFEKSLEKTKQGKPFVFYEGPPTANGKPGIHHVLARAFKDVIVRYQTLRGRYVARKGGWDTHGLPVELQIEKELGISGKKQIENIVADDKRASIAEFNARCKASVTHNILDWESLTRRIGFWLDMDHAYRTYTNDYMESLWSIIKQMSETETPDGPLLYEGHKVVQHCPRCETALSSHEVAQGYKTVRDTSVYVKFLIKSTPLLKAQAFLEEDKKVYLLSWTTTPWTLPGNVALAIDEALTYALVEVNGEYLVCAESRVSVVFGDDAKVTLTFRGKDILGTTYAPLFEGSIDAKDSKTAWTVLAATFVTANDGTGIVHTAVMYGEDDYQLGLSAGLPRQHTVDQTGHFMDSVKLFAGKFVKDAETEKSILDELHNQNLLYKIEPYSHEYPFCWRCSTPLLYYAKDSWFVRMSALREQLQYNNKSINWVPSHIKDGRFGEWLKEVKDWAFSRERYWGTPLPIWVCETCKRKEVIGSLKELESRATKSSLPEKTRTVFVMRHGKRPRADDGKGIIASVIEKDTIELTSEGIEETEKIAKELKGKIDLIISSDFLRTKQTSEIIAEKTGAQIVYDSRLRELFYPSLEGQTTVPLKKMFPEDWMRVHHAPEGGETLYAVAQRMKECVMDSVQRYDTNRILFVSHGDPLWALSWLLSGKDEKEISDIPYPKQGEYHEVTLHKIPLNPHRPYVDDITLRCTCEHKGKMKRVEEVADVWFDSGSMPFAQSHFPFENESKLAFPADYISEAIDQTRGWFYTMLAVSTVLKKEAPYRNVICLGHILDAKGEKMSKSKGNIVNPWDVIAETGSDALRLHFFTMNQPGDSKLFAIEGVREVVRKTMMMLWNVQSFYLLHSRAVVARKPADVVNILDTWLLSEFEDVKQTVTAAYDSYKVFEANRRLRSFVDELSTWYVRRSRGRMKDDVKSQEVFGAVLFQLIQLFAPSIPIFAEMCYQRFEKNASDPLSIHLTDWPAAWKEFEDAKLRHDMNDVRDAVEAIHSIRKDSAIKSRQPLSAAFVSQKLSDPLALILQDEVNVDGIVTGTKPTEAGWIFKDKSSITYGINSVINEDLLKRGKIRDVLRHINDLRKLARLQPGDRIDFFVATDKDTETFLRSIERELSSAARIDVTTYALADDVDVKRIVAINKKSVTFALKKRP